MSRLGQPVFGEYFPPKKVNQTKIVINTFAQEADESMAKAWERFQDLLRKCLSHGLDYDQMCTFLGGSCGTQNYP